MEIKGLCRTNSSLLNTKQTQSKRSGHWYSSPSYFNGLQLLYSDFFFHIENVTMKSFTCLLLMFLAIAMLVLAIVTEAKQICRCAGNKNLRAGIEKCGKGAGYTCYRYWFSTWCEISSGSEQEELIECCRSVDQNLYGAECKNVTQRDRS